MVMSLYILGVDVRCWCWAVRAVVKPLAPDEDAAAILNGLYLLFEVGMRTTLIEDLEDPRRAFNSLEVLRWQQNLGNKMLHVFCH